MANESNQNKISKRRVKLKKLKTYLVILLLPMLIGLAPVVFLLSSKPETAEADWYNDSWGYRKPLIIDNTGSADANKKVKFDIDTAALITANKLQSDCGDSRFTDGTGQLLEYYIDTSGGACNTNSTDYYVLVPTIYAGDTLLYHYYGNPNADNGTVAAQFSQATFTPNSTSAGTEEAAPAPAGYWKFDEGYGNTTYGFYGNNGTISGALWKTDNLCINGNCLQYDGTDDYVSVSASPTIDFNAKSGYSICSWIKPITDGEGNAGEFWSKGSTYLRVDTESAGTVELSASLDLATTDATYNSTRTIQLSQWNYVCVTYTDDADDELTMYVNGEVFGSSTNGDGSPADDSASVLYIGGDSSNNFDGFIDEVKVYAYERTASEIKTDYITKTSQGTSAVMGASTDTLQSGLVGYWKMDETSWNGTSNEVKDSSGNGNDGTAADNATTTILSKYHYGGTYDGTDDAVNVTSSDSLNTTTGLTVAAWVYRQSVTDSNYPLIVTKENFVSDKGFALGDTLSTSDTTVRFRLNGSSGDGYVTETTLEYSTWIHYVGTFDGKTSRLYKNGVLVDSEVQPFSSISTDSTALTLGNGHYYGKMDEVRIYNRALNGREITALYNWAPPPVAKYSMNENTGTTINDISENANTSSAFTGDVAWMPGKYGSGLYFDGDGDVVRITESTSTDFGQVDDDSFTVGAWIKTSKDFSADGTIVAKNDADPASTSNVYPFYLYVDASEKVCFYSRNNLESGQKCSDTTINDGKWHYITGVRREPYSYLEIYVDGRRELNGAGTGGTDFIGNPDNDDDISIGNSGSSYTAYDFEGFIDEVVIYNYARTKEQIINDMNAGHPSVGSPVGSPSLYLKFDEGYGDTAYDISISGLNGDLGETTYTCPAASSSCPAWTKSGKFGGALSFDGDDIVELAENEGLDPGTGNQQTISAWIKTNNDFSSAVHIYSNYYEDSTFQSIVLGVGSDDKVYGFIGDLATNSITIYGQSTINDNKWHHIVLVKVDQDNLQLYVDGILEDQDTNASMGDINLYSSVSGLPTVGSRYDGAYNFVGSIDEVKVYNFALTSDEVKADYTQGKAVVGGALSTDSSGNASWAGDREYCVPGDTSTCNGPVVEYKMDEASGSILYDTSGNELNLDNKVNNPVFTKGKYGGGVKFNGASSSGDAYYKTDTTGSVLDITDELTITFWFNLTSAPGVSDYWYITTKGDTTTDKDNNYECFVSDNALGCAIGDTSGFQSVSTGLGTGEPPVGEWVFGAYIVDGTDVKLYMNGILEAVSSQTRTPVANDQELVVGAATTTGGNSFKGIIDNFRIYDYARSDEQILWEYNHGKPLLQYRFDECEGTTIYDNSGKGKNGTINYGGTGNTSAGTCSSGDTTEMWNNGTNGKFNASLDFDGSNDYVASSNTFIVRRSINATYDNFSWGGWFKPASTPTSDTLIHKDEEFRLTTDSNGYPQCEIYATSWQTAAAATSALPTSTWSHVFCTYDGSNIRLYVNGELKDTQAETDSITQINGSALNIARDSASSGYFDGQIDDIRIYNYVPTATQLKAIISGSIARF